MKMNWIEYKEKFLLKAVIFIFLRKYKKKSEDALDEKMVKELSYIILKIDSNSNRKNLI